MENIISRQAFSFACVSVWLDYDIWDSMREFFVGYRWNDLCIKVKSVSGFVEIFKGAIHEGLENNVPLKSVRGNKDYKPWFGRNKVEAVCEKKNFQKWFSSLQESDRIVFSKIARSLRKSYL